MRNSNSFISQSIHVSQTQQAKFAQPMNATKSKEINKDTVVSNKPDEKMFLKYYEQNLQLKNKQVELYKEIKDLRERVNRKDQNAKISLENQLKIMAQGKKSQWDTVKQPLVKNKAASRGFSGNKNLSATKIEQLLQIIDHYKQKLMTSEQQNQNLRRQKFLLQQDLKLNNKRVDTLKDDSSQMNLGEEINLSGQLKTKIRQIQLEKERGKFLELSIKGLEAKLRSAELKVDQYENIKAQNRILEEKIIRMTQLPNFNNVIDKADEQRKAKELENKLKLLNEKYNSLKDNTLKTEAELRLMQNKLIETTSDLNSLQKQNVILREQSINDPIVVRLMKQPELIQKILYQIQKDKTNDRTKKGFDSFESKSQIEKLILEKEELARHLLNLQTKMASAEEGFKERQRLSKLEKQVAVVAVNQPKGITSKQGVIYEGQTDVFTQQIGSVPLGSNYFDLFLGEINLLETMVLSVTGLSNPSSPLLLATVDFYNHNTQHSKLTQGCRCDLQSQFSFRVTQDDFFLKYLQKGTFQIDVWASEGSKNYHLGKATIEMKALVLRSRPRISPIVSTAVPLYMNQKVMGSINVVIRLRQPIYDQLQRLRQVGTGGVEGQEQAAARRLVIQIDEGNGFGEKSNTFVYYPFRLQDQYTRTSKGNSPNWSHLKMLEIRYDNDFKNYLRKNEIEFTVFDDNVLVMDEKSSDVVGSAVISLLPLLEGKSIKERLEIKKGAQRRGTIDVKIYWYQTESEESNALKQEQQRKFSVAGIHQELKCFMKEREVDAEKIYRMMDWNRTGNVSYEEFVEWLEKYSSRKFSPQIMSNYYKGFKQPVNFVNFTTRVNRETQSEKLPEPLVTGLTQINQLLKINSTQMKKKTLEQFLRGKNILEIAQNMEMDRLGYISRQKLQLYFDQQGIEAEIPEQRVKLLEYLKKRQT